MIGYKRRVRWRTRPPEAIATLDQPMGLCDFCQLWKQAGMIKNREVEQTFWGKKALVLPMVGNRLKYS